MTIQLGKRLNGGGTGALHEGPDDTVYKITRGDSASNADLMHEFHMLSRVNEIADLPVQKVLEAGNHEGRCYMQFKRIHGEALGDMIMDDALSREDIMSIREQISQIFDKLAEKGLYHGDADALGNYIITRSSGAVKVTIVDFVEGGTDPTGNTARAELAQIDTILAHLVKDPEPDPEHLVQAL